MGCASNPPAAQPQPGPQKPSQAKLDEVRANAQRALKTPPLVVPPNQHRPTKLRGQQKPRLSPRGQSEPPLPLHPHPNPKLGKTIPPFSLEPKVLVHQRQPLRKPPWPSSRDWSSSKLSRNLKHLNRIQMEKRNPKSPTSTRLHRKATSLASSMSRRMKVLVGLLSKHS